MTKEALKGLADTAARDYIENGTDPTVAVEKVARREHLTGDQIDRVCEYTNTKINSALLDKQAYTDFPLARPGEIRSTKTKSAESVATVRARGGSEKTASTGDTADLPSQGTFSKLASAYGSEYVPSPNDRENARRLIKAAETIGRSAAMQLKGNAIKLANERERMYNEARQSVLSGVPAEEVFQKLEEKGVDEDVLVYLARRMSAEGLIEPPEKDDAGPYSVQRELRKSGALRETEWTLPDDSPLMKAARDLGEARRDVLFNVRAIEMGEKVARHADDLAGVSDEGLQEKQASAIGTIFDKSVDFMNSMGSAGKKVFETGESMAKNTGEWVSEEPLSRGLGLTLGGMALGEFAGNTKDKWTEPKSLSGS